MKANSGNGARDFINLALDFSPTSTIVSRKTRQLLHHKSIFRSRRAKLTPPAQEIPDNPLHFCLQPANTVAQNLSYIGCVLGLTLIVASWTSAQAEGPKHTRVFLITDYGALSDDVAANTAAVQRALDACATAGGGQVVVPAATQVTVGSIELKSHTELHLERGSVLRASPRHADFRILVPYPVDFDLSHPLPKIGAMVVADDAEDIAITGPGTLDGNSPAYILESGDEIHRCPHQRPFTVHLKNCRRVLLRDIVIHNGAFWTVRLLGCYDVGVDKIHIDNDILMPNNDGIDVDRSANVRITDCDIRCGDDCISLKTSPESWGIDRPCENVIISGCNLMSRSGAVMIGCDVTSPIRDVVVDSCVIKQSHRGIGVRLSLEGSMEHLLFSNIIIETRMDDDRWWGRAEPIHISAVPWNEKRTVGVIHDVRFSNIICRGENGVVIYAEQPGKIDGIQFDRVSVEINKTTDWPAGRQDFRPKQADQMPQLPTSGFLLRNAANVTLRNCNVTWGPHRDPAFHNAIDAENSPGLVADGLTGDSADPSQYPARNIR
jgi:Glycosyl hydrolases family 28